MSFLYTWDAGSPGSIKAEMFNMTLMNVLEEVSDINWRDAPQKKKGKKKHFNKSSL